MKKTLIFAILLTALMFSSCNKAERTVVPEKPPETAASQIIIDKTISLDSIDTSGKKVVCTVGSIPDFAVVYNNLKDLTAGSDYIIKGEILKISYFNVLGHAHTNLTVKVDKSFKGNLPDNSAISVIEVGGINTIKNLIDFYGQERFKDVTEYDRENCLVNDKFYGAPFSEVGEKVILFMKEITDTSSAMKGSYMPIGTFMGKYTLNNGLYERYSPDNKFYYSKDNTPVNRKYDPATIEEQIGLLVK